VAANAAQIDRLVVEQQLIAVNNDCADSNRKYVPVEGHPVSLQLDSQVIQMW
jgi:hypothetical protein